MAYLWEGLLSERYVLLRFGVTIFLTQNWGGPLFFKLDLVEGYDFLSLYIFTKSQYNVQETLSERFLSFKQIVRYTNVAATDICRWWDSPLYRSTGAFLSQWKNPLKSMKAPNSQNWLIWSITLSSS